MAFIIMPQAEKDKLNIVVLMGGPSTEHEVSLATGKKIIDTLDKNKYNFKSIVITKDGKWLLPPEDVNRLNSVVEKNETDLISMESGKAIERLKMGTKTDVALIAMHGTYGEDGTIQGLLELAGIPYTCSGVLASALAMNKEMTKRILKSEKILMPSHVILEKNFSPAELKKIKLPAVIKPVQQGSSVGVSIVNKKSELAKAIEESFKFGQKIIIEEFIKGQEITAAVLGNKNPVALPLIEIKPKFSNFFDYRAKYEVGGSEEICPAPISEFLTKKIQDIALRIHKILNCRGVTRSDFILKDKKPYFLEINTIPGMTATSLVPQAATKAGISFSELLDKLINLALE